MTKKIYLILLFLGITLFALNAQNEIVNPVKWRCSAEKIDDTHVNLIIEANIEEHWHLYSQYFEMGGPMPLFFEFEESDYYSIVDNITENPAPKTIFDDIFEIEVKYFEKYAKFIQKIEVKSKNGFTIKGTLDGQVCFDDGKCLMLNEEFSFDINGGSPKTDGNLVDVSKKNTPIIITENPFSDFKDKEQSLLVFFLISILFGFIGVLTPCVFPMIPMTVSFFMQDTKNKLNEKLKAIIFGISIIFLYTLVGVIVSLTSAGADFTTVLSSNWIPNLIFFLLFLIFASSLFGLFEIPTLSGLANKADRQVDKGGLISAFFLAVTLVIVSFACTGPIVGALLVQAASGNFLEPTIGMLGFGFGFALPFTLLALAPKALSKLPKSGGWLNSVKIVMGFIILAFSLKFLSNIDQNYHLNLLSRDVYIAIWIVLSFMLGLYSLGKIKFHLDSDEKNIGFFRFIFAISCFIFSIYLFPGLFGANLTGISGLLPPKTTQKFDLTINNNINSKEAKNTLCESPKYADIMHIPYNINGYFDYNQALNCAKNQNKPLLLYFTGHSCSNCKVMQSEVWANPKVQDYLNNDLILTVLYVDEKTITVSEEEQFVSSNKKN